MLVFRYKWDDTAWVLDCRSTFEYNEAGLQTLYISEKKIDGEFQNTERVITEYDEADQEIVLLIQIWETEWQNFIRIIFDYDEAGNRILTYQQAWQDNAWQDKRRRTRAYTVGGNLTKILDAFDIDGVLVNVSRKLYYYDTFTSIK